MTTFRPPEPALQLCELQAFKVDHTAYNSYLYRGQMLVPKTSHIALEDKAAEFGAQTGKNIKVTPSKQHQNRNNNSTYSQVVPHSQGGSQIVNSNSTTVASKRNTRGATNKGNNNNNNNSNTISQHSEDDVVFSFDSDEDDYVQSVLSEKQKTNNNNNINNKTTTKQQQQQRIKKVTKKNDMNDESDDDNSDVDDDNGQGNDSNSNRVKKNQIEDSDDECQSLLQNLLRRDRQTNNGNSNDSLPYNIVPIVVKYPLMGSLDDWKDSFQTCQEEVTLYRQIETWKCPFLLRYYGTHGPGLVFEFVDGESLDTYLFHAASDVEIEQQTWLWSELGLHISTGLLYLHKLNISHNDIKPENVRYSASKRCWKLLDLGLATDFDMKVCRQIGTNGYRAPEVAETGLLNRKSDVYSLGVMMDDALESIVKRYQIFEDICDDYDEVLKAYEELMNKQKNKQQYNNKSSTKNNSRSNTRNNNKDQENIDLDAEAKRVLLSYVKRRRPDSLPITTEAAKTIVIQSQRWVAFLEVARGLIKQMLSDIPDERPSVLRLLACFRELLPAEQQFRAYLHNLRRMGI